MLTDNYRPKVIFSVTNCICFDQRVMKMANTVSSLNCEITIVGRKKGLCCDSASVPFITKRFRMLFKRGFLFYKWFNIRLFFYLLFHKFDILVANDLDTLLPNYLISKIRRLPLIYDSHEYFTGVPELQNRPFVKWVWMSIEKSIFPKLKYVITVSDSIAELYSSLYKVKPIVIRNLSKSAKHIIPLSRQEIGVSESDLLLITQGTGINKDKGYEELIDAVAITSDVTLLIVGSGDLMAKLKLKIEELKLVSRVILIPTVKWETLLRYTKSADIGMVLEKDTNLNYRFSLPNKLFDYISAGIPVIASELPETSIVISDYSCGILLSKVSPDLISISINELKNNPVKLAQLKCNSILASEKLNWETESEKVKILYKTVLKGMML